MKLKLFICVLIMVFSQSLFSQLRMMKANNCNAKYYTNTPFTWSGPIVNGYCHGNGTIQWFDSKGNKSSKMVGAVKNGKAEGYCTFYTSAGVKIFEGHYVNDMRNGRGIIYYSDGTFEEGEWMDDNRIDDVVVDTLATDNLFYTVDKSTVDETLDDELKQSFKELLEAFCYINYSSCFSGRKYIEYSLIVNNVEEVENRVYKFEGTHSYKGSYGAIYSDMLYKATLYLTQKKIVFYKRSKADFFNPTDYWEECTKQF